MNSPHPLPSRLGVVAAGGREPVRVDDIRDHRMHEEWFSIPVETARIVNQAKADGRRVVAVGTTSVRTLEYASRPDGVIQPGSGRCDLFIYPAQGQDRDLPASLRS